MESLKYLKQGYLISEKVLKLIEMYEYGYISLSGLVNELTLKIQENID